MIISRVGRHRPPRKIDGHKPGLGQQCSHYGLESAPSGWRELPRQDILILVCQGVGDAGDEHLAQPSLNDEPWSTPLGRHPLTHDICVNDRLEHPLFSHGTIIALYTVSSPHEQPSVWRQCVRLTASLPAPV